MGGPVIRRRSFDSMEIAAPRRFRSLLIRPTGTEERFPLRLPGLSRKIAREKTNVRKAMRR
jgi:hypothetical protein